MSTALTFVGVAVCVAGLAAIIITGHASVGLVAWVLAGEVFAFVAFMAGEIS